VSDRACALADSAIVNMSDESPQRRVLASVPTGRGSRRTCVMPPVTMAGPDGRRKGKLRIIAEPLEEYVVKSVMARYLESPAFGSGVC
jgi:hypothetical protein